MSVEIKNELRADATVDGSVGGGVIQIFGFAGFVRTGVGVYEFSFSPEAQVDPSVHSIYCTTGINELAMPRARLVSSELLEVRSYSPGGVPVDCVTLFVRVHRYPTADGAVPLPPAPPIPTPTPAAASKLLGWVVVDLNGVIQEESIPNLVDGPVGHPVLGNYEYTLVAGTPVAAAAISPDGTLPTDVTSQVGGGGPLNVSVRTFNGSGAAANRGHSLFFYSV